MRQTGTIQGGSSASGPRRVLSGVILTQQLVDRPPCIRVGSFSSSQFADLPDFRHHRRTQLLERFAPIEHAKCFFAYEDLPIVVAGDESWAFDPEPRPFPSASLGDCRAVTLEEFCDLLLLHEFLDVSGWVRCGDCGEPIDSQSGYVAYLDESFDLRLSQRLGEQQGAHLRRTAGASSRLRRSARSSERSKT